MWSKTQDLQMSAEQSYDPNMDPDNQSLLHYHWECQNTSKVWTHDNLHSRTNDQGFRQRSTRPPAQCDVVQKQQRLRTLLTARPGLLQFSIFCVTELWGKCGWIGMLFVNEWSSGEGSRSLSPLFVSLFNYRVDFFLHVWPCAQKFASTTFILLLGQNLF